MASLICTFMWSFLLSETRVCRNGHPDVSGRRCITCARAAKKRNQEKFGALYRERHSQRRKDPIVFEHEESLKRTIRLRKLYGITQEDYEQLLADQNGSCAICGTKDSGNKRSRYFMIDHCHVSGEVRGLLCVACNVRLGQMEANKEVVLKTIDYAQKNGSWWRDYLVEMGPRRK